MAFPYSIKTVLRAGTVLGLAVVTLSSARVRADIIPVLDTVTPHGANCTFSYEADLTNNETVQTSDFFTIYDFNGLVAGSNFQPANWVFSSALVGPTPPSVSPKDNATIPNISWAYTAAATIGPGPLNLGMFGADSTFCKTHLTPFATLAHKYDPGKPDNNSLVSNVGTTGGPSATIPEASALALLVPGLAPLGLALRRWRSA